MRVNPITTNGARLWDSLMAMAKIGALPNGGCGRLALTPEDIAGRDLFVGWCRDAGCGIETDDMGNIFARRPGTNNTRAPIATGSHLDTQPHGGKFDGIYGVLAGLEVIRTLNDRNIRTEAPIEVIVWTNEEGSRFAPAMVASGVYAGIFDKDYAYSRVDEDGITLGQALRDSGYQGDAPCGDHILGALFEAHIEQGPILEAEQLPIGVVIGGQGQRWFDITVAGVDAHSGSTPMPGRRDALVAASMMVQAIEVIAGAHAPHGVGTVGAMTVSPNSRNTIPGRVDFTVDLRNPDDNVLAAMGQKLRCELQRIANERGVSLTVEEIWHNPPVVFDPSCVHSVRKAANAQGSGYREMVSGAGHDACMVARKVPTSMIFVPCAGGISHNEAESAEPEHLAIGCDVLLNAMLDHAGRA